MADFFVGWVQIFFLWQFVERQKTQNFFCYVHLLPSESSKTTSPPVAALLNLAKKLRDKYDFESKGTIFVEHKKSCLILWADLLSQSKKYGALHLHLVYIFDKLSCRGLIIHSPVLQFIHSINVSWFHHFFITDVN